MNQENLKETLKAILEYSELTSCKAKIDLEENLISVDFSAVIKEMNSTQRLRRSIFDVLGRGLSEVNREFITSGITPLEQIQMKMKLGTNQIHNNKRNEMI
jgi:hypothetical protein